MEPPFEPLRAISKINKWDINATTGIPASCFCFRFQCPEFNETKLFGFSKMSPANKILWRPSDPSKTQMDLFKALVSSRYNIDLGEFTLTTLYNLPLTTLLQYLPPKMTTQLFTHGVSMRSRPSGRRFGNGRRLVPEKGKRVKESSVVRNGTR